jgi:hypothetical protein
MRLRSMRSSWRVAAALVAGILAGSILITPALGHMGSIAHLWSEHFQPRADARYERPLYAVVQALDGPFQGTRELVRGRGAISVNAEGLVNGQTRVRFNRAIGSCAWTATPGHPDATLIGDPTSISVSLASPDTIFVQTRNPTVGLVNRPFHLAVTC